MDWQVMPAVFIVSFVILSIFLSTIGLVNLPALGLKYNLYLCDPIRFFLYFWKNNRIYSEDE
jgi:hypothetical protein